MSYTVLVTAPTLARAGLARLEQAGCRVVLLTDTKDGAEVERRLAGHPVDAVISRTVDLSARAIVACPTLKVVSKHGVGVSNIAVDACTARQIPVYVTPGANAQAVAELTITLMGAAARRVAFLDREIRAGRWTRAQDGVDLAGRTLGIVGFGQIGRLVARVALAIGMQVVAFDPFAGPARADQAEVAEVTRVDSLDALLAASSVLSLHVPLTPATRGLIDARALGLLPHGAIVVNTARGEVIDEPALIEALSSGRLHAAGLDTVAQEPLPAGSPLRDLPNVILTPHVGGSTPGALATMALMAVANVIGYLEGHPPDPTWCVNADVFSTSAKGVS